MSRATIQDVITTLQAALDGKSVAMNNPEDGVERCVPFDEWCLPEIRIKPKPREGWVRAMDIHSHIDDCDQVELVRVREVIE